MACFAVKGILRVGLSRHCRATTLGDYIQYEYRPLPLWVLTIVVFYTYRSAKGPAGSLLGLSVGSGGPWGILAGLALGHLGLPDAPRA